VKINLSEDRKLNVSLESDAQQLAEVVVSAESKNANVSKAEMSIEKLSALTTLIIASPAVSSYPDKKK
jgi:hypothetical protein